MGRWNRCPIAIDSMLMALFALVWNGWWKLLWRGGTVRSLTDLGVAALTLVALTGLRVWSLTGRPGSIPTVLRFLALGTLRRNRLVPWRR